MVELEFVFEVETDVGGLTEFGIGLGVDGLTEFVI